MYFDCVLQHALQEGDSAVSGSCERPEPQGKLPNPDPLSLFTLESWVQMSGTHIGLGACVLRIWQLELKTLHGVWNVLQFYSTKKLPSSDCDHIIKKCD